ncbi:RNA-directed DNA polymerase, eukaryota, reverse transcriptase zinc-binding domain protein [Tanacetum coccineum]|uniref:RNA-directed DNA polymerase, eukaryota, reverse transcriptase zinc-binding domain protein n=1 Tax=Tanacetum coccineum TaxID=301880 RepID=A0ABQ5BUT3_9ASTR
MNESDDTLWESSEGNPMEINKEKFMQENIQDNVNKDHRKSYAVAVQNKSQTLDTSLNFRPTVTDDDGCEFVIFDEELGCYMAENALRYHVRRMWSKYGFIDVQDPTIGLEKKDETKIPLWAKIKNIPLETWTKDRISALASSLGKPLRMDNIIAQKGELRYFEKKGRDINGVYKRKEVVKEVQNDQQKDNTDKSNDAQSKEAKGKEEEMDKRTKLKSLKDRILVDQYLNKKMQPTCAEAQNRSKDMISYFKLKWEEDRMKEKESQHEDIEDVMEGHNMI